MINSWIAMPKKPTVDCNLLISQCTRGLWMVLLQEAGKIYMTLKNRNANPDGRIGVPQDSDRDVSDLFATA